VFFFANMETATSRRPLKTRERGWAKAAAQLLVKAHVSPNAISILSLVFGGGAGVALYFSGQTPPFARMWLLLLAAAGIQSRLLCNMLDGMVAVEGGRQTKSGEVFNDLPDRIADAILLICAGYAVWEHAYALQLGYGAAMLAVFTAYVRMLGGASGLKQSFIGPMAKQQRMAVLTIACLLSPWEIRLQLRSGSVLWVTLIVINIGCLVTIVRRTARIVRELEAR
jgi:phosphatidylglycerophosphate synthase